MVRQAQLQIVHHRQPHDHKISVGYQVQEPVQRANRQWCAVPCRPGRRRHHSPVNQRRPINQAMVTKRRICRNGAVILPQEEVGAIIEYSRSRGLVAQRTTRAHKPVSKRGFVRLIFTLQINK